MRALAPAPQTAEGLREVKGAIGAYLDAAAERAQHAVNEMPSEADELEKYLAQGSVTDYRRAKDNVETYVDAQWVSAAKPMRRQQQRQR